MADKISITICGDGGCGMFSIVWWHSRRERNLIGSDQGNPRLLYGWSVVNGFTSNVFFSRVDVHHY